MHKNAQLSPRLETARKPYHTPDDMYLINPSLIAAISRVLRGDAKHLRIGVGDDLKALGNKANAVIKNENAQR